MLTRAVFNEPSNNSLQSYLSCENGLCEELLSMKPVTLHKTVLEGRRCHLEV